MGGCRCSYKNCTNTTKTRENLHFFHYPVKQKDRCKQWIENANKPQFYDLDEDQLRNKVICETHFESHFFPNTQKKRLLQGAIPTLDGDCEPTQKQTNNHQTLNNQDVQVLPVNDDGTHFFLETNMENSYRSAKVESYIYTNSGTMVPIHKAEAVNNSFSGSVYSINDSFDVEEFECVKVDSEMSTNIPMEFTSSNGDYESDTILENSSLEHKPVSIQTQTLSCKTPNCDEVLKTIDIMYGKTIRQHSKDIANIKRRLFKSKAMSIQTKPKIKKPNNYVIMRSLKNQIPSSLYNILGMNLDVGCDLTHKDLDFFLTIYSLSPPVYELLVKQFQWRLPEPQFLRKMMKKINGQVSSSDEC